MHGVSPEMRAAEAASKEAAQKVENAEKKPAQLDTAAGASDEGGANRAAVGAGRGPARAFSAALDPRAKADLVQFQVYVRQRLAELATRMPPRKSTRETAELAFLEEEVVLDHMPRAKRRLRDPLRDVPETQIAATNLPLLSRFVSEAGAILPRRLTGVSQRKQRKLTKAIKRAHQLALMPKTWKLPRYRHASYADQYSQPDKSPYVSPDPAFRDPPDIRFPNQWEKKRDAYSHDFSRLVRSGSGLAPNPAGSLTGSPPEKRK